MKKKYGYLTISEVDRSTGIKKFLCRCKCGNTKLVTWNHLVSGLVKSCGCLKTKHGMSTTRFYNVWSSMLKRCYQLGRKDAKNYKDKGIRVCKRWHSFLHFRDDMLESYSKHYKENKGNTQLDRIKAQKGYGPKNCRWLTALENVRNRKDLRWITFNGITLPLAGWAKKIGMSSTGLADRIRFGWKIEKALTTPKNGTRHQKRGKYKVYVPTT